MARNPAGHFWLPKLTIAEWTLGINYALEKSFGAAEWSPSCLQYADIPGCFTSKSHCQADPLACRTNCQFSIQKMEEVYVPKSCCCSGSHLCDSPWRGRLWTQGAEKGKPLFAERAVCVSLHLRIPVVFVPRGSSGTDTATFPFRWKLVTWKHLSRPHLL